MLHVIEFHTKAEQYYYCEHIQTALTLSLCSNAVLNCLLLCLPPSCQYALSTVQLFPLASRTKIVCAQKELVKGSFDKSTAYRVTAQLVKTRITKEVISFLLFRNGVSRDLLSFVVIF